MTVTASPSPTTLHTANAPSEVRRALALAKMELILLWRNRTALFTAVLTPLLLVGMFSLLPNGVTGPPAVLGLVLGSSLLFVVYYTLVTSVVARREQHTLKRLYTGPTRPVTTLVGMGLPLVALLLVQMVVGLIAVGATSGLGDPARLWLLIPAMLGGAAVWWVLALASSVFTRTVEAAQLTTLPLMLVALLFSGLSFPLALVPELMQTLAQFTPMFPVVDLTFLAFNSVRVTSVAVEGAALGQAIAADLAVLGAWLAGTILVLRRRFRWEPRR